MALVNGPFDGERRRVEFVQVGVTRAMGQKGVPHMDLPNVIEVGEGDEIQVYEKRAGGGYYLHRGPKPRAEGDAE